MSWGVNPRGVKPPSRLWYRKVLQPAKLWYGTDELMQVKVFKYLGRMVSSVDNNVPAMHHSLKRARKV